MTLIKTIVKFNKKDGAHDNKLFGFITKIKGSWRGCRDTEEKKKIVLVDALLVDDIIPNVPYRCTLSPMKNGNGFVAIFAKPLKFDEKISVLGRPGRNTVLVRWGCKTLTYNPASDKEYERDIQKIANNLRRRNDLNDPNRAAEEFINEALLVKRLYDQYKEDV